MTRASTAYDATPDNWLLYVHTLHGHDILEVRVPRDETSRGEDLRISRTGLTEQNMRDRIRQSGADDHQFSITFLVDCVLIVKRNQFR
jgi:hypothetical protein